MAEDLCQNSLPGAQAAAAAWAGRVALRALERPMRLLVLAAAACGTQATAAAVVQIFPNLGPTRVDFGPGGPQFESPHYVTYRQNAMAALRTGAASHGGPQQASPSAFEVMDGVVVTNSAGSVKARAGDMVATPFNSWRGDLAPSGAFSAEHGTFFRAAVAVQDSARFTMLDVVVDASYHPAFGVPPGCCTFPLGVSYPPGDDRVEAVDWGADGIAGTADDVVYDSANPTLQPDTLVNALYFLGFGEFGVLDAVLPPAALYALWQEQFDAWAAQGAGITTTYTLRDASASVTVQAVPEPQVGALLALGLVGLALGRQSSRAATRAARP